MPCKSSADQYTYYMPKRLIFLVLGIIATISVAVVLLVNVTKKEKITSPIDENNKEKVVDGQKLSDNLKEYIDSSGFKFKYPDNFSVSTSDQLNENIYSLLTLSSDEMTEKTSLLVEATSAKSLDDWLTQNSQKISKEKLQKTKLADLEAIQYEKDNKVITVAYDTGVLFTIITELTSKRETMLKLNETILSTFAFSPPDSTDASSQTSSAAEEDVIFEGEETVE